MLTGKKIVVGVTGGIAAYKACDLVSRLKKRGAQVRVVLTEHACQFVQPLSFETLSGNPAYTDSFDRKYEGIARFPAVTRDISMVVPKEILAGDIEAVIEQRGGKNLESYQLFDVYEGSQIKAGYKSLAYSIVFRSKEKTLEEAEISGAMKKILKALESMGIELRQ